MTDTEVDQWLDDHGEYEASVVGELTVYQLRRCGDAFNRSVTVAVATSQLQPPEEETRRFLARWFLSGYEPSEEHPDARLR